MRSTGSSQSLLGSSVLPLRVSLSSRCNFLAHSLEAAMSLMAQQEACRVISGHITEPLIRAALCTKAVGVGHSGAIHLRVTAI